MMHDHTGKNGRSNQSRISRNYYGVKEWPFIILPLSTEILFSFYDYTSGCRIIKSYNKQDKRS